MGTEMKVKRKKKLSGARGTWLRKPQTQVEPNAKIYRRKGRREAIRNEEV